MNKMSKKNLAIVLVTSLFPRITLAHFEDHHEPVWQEPMHYVLQHYQTGFLVVIIALMAVLVIKKLSDKE